MTEYTSFEDVTPPEGEIELPRGYIVKQGGENVVFSRARLRETSGAEEDIMFSSKMSFTKKMMRVVRGCLVALIDKDGREINDEKAFESAVQTMTIGDLTACMFEIRSITRGTEFLQKVTCPNPQCSTIKNVPFSWTARFDLREDFPPQKCKGDPAHVVRTYRTSRGREITWKFMTGEDRIKFESNMKDETVMTAILMMRVLTINGEPANVTSLQKLSLVEREEIRDHMLPQEGGIETSFDATCKNCGHEFKGDLEISGFDFFYPSETQDA